MELKRTKKKTGLLVVALALVAVLAVAGTLMLFTAQSKTATNVVTLDGLDILLHEDDGNGYWQVTTDDTFDFYGPNGTTTVPGDTVVKKAKISNESQIPAYTFVKVIFTIKDAGGPIDFTTQANRDKYFGTGASLTEVAAFFNEFVAGVNVGTNWIELEMLPAEIFNFATATAKGGYFYVEGPIARPIIPGTNDPTSAQKILKVLAGSTETQPVFDQVKIPSSINGDAWAGVTFSLDVTGYAVQSDNSPYDRTMVDPGDYRTKAFAELKDQIGLW